MSQDSMPKLLDQIWNKIRFLHYSRKTEQSYTQWIRRYIIFHNKRHPKDIAGEEMVYTHVLNKGGNGVKSPLDNL